MKSILAIFFLAASAAVAMPQVNEAANNGAKVSVGQQTGS